MSPILLYCITVLWALAVGLFCAYKDYKRTKPKMYFCKNDPSIEVKLINDVKVLIKKDLEYQCVVLSKGYPSKLYIMGKDYFEENFEKKYPDS